MHIQQFLHKTLSPVMHLKRLETLKLLVSTALTTKRLSVTGLGRGMETKALEKSNILRSDRFMGNIRIHEEREYIYETTIKLLIGLKHRPWIIVDWSHVPNTTHYVLRAALVATGRALTIYEEVHPKEKENNATVHTHFLKKISQLLSIGCQPIIITDAGFHNPWFKEIIKLGWDYVARIRGRKCFRYYGEKTWNQCKGLFEKATTKGRHIGEVDLCRENSMRSQFYLIKQTDKFRKRLNKYGKKGSHKKDKEYSKSANEPWLLATSLKGGAKISKKIFKIYATRMQIEEGFRDLKSSKYGFSFEDAGSKNILRIQILLLIAMLASLVAWLTGHVAERNGWQFQFQANSIKTKRILSLFFLGCQVIRKKLAIPINKFLKGIEYIQGYSLCIE